MFDKNLFLIDTETAGSIGYPRPYDVSYLIGNPQTKEILCSRAYVVREIWEDEELMASAYYASKRDLYKRDIESGKRKVLPWAVICKIIREDMAKYNCSTIGAYNMNFDHRAMDNDAKYITRGKYRFAFPKETDFICVWRMACTSILRSKWFFKWADANNAFTACGNLSYQVLFLQGGASLQFAMIPMNFASKEHPGNYVLSGSFATKAYKEARGV